MITKIFRWINLPAFLIIGLLFYLSSLPGTMQSPLQHPWDKVVHCLFFMGLSWCLAFWVRGKRWQEQYRLHVGMMMVVAALVGALDEFHQSFVPGRDVSLLDWLADLSGAAIGLFLYTQFRVWRWVDRLYFNSHLV